MSSSFRTLTTVTRGALAVLLALATGTASTAAHAGDPPKRPTPDYDGRGEPPTTAGDVALWVPRLVVSPIYLTSEYLVRRPVGGLVVGIEKNHVVSQVIDFFTFDKEHKVGLVPIAYYDFGFLPSVGLYFFWDDFFAKGNNFHVHASTWGPDWLKLAVADTIPLGAHGSLALRAAWTRRSDQLYYGLGPRSLESSRSRYQATIADVSGVFDQRIVRGVNLTTTVGFRDARFEDSGCCDDPTLQTRARQDHLPLPPGIVDGYTIGYQRMELSLDSRPELPAAQSGVRVALEAQPSFDMKSPHGASWLRYGGTAAAFVDLTGHRRVLSLEITALFVDPIHGEGSDIPFTEQIVLGGTRYMRGYKIGRLVDRSAAMATLEYQWPIWVWLDGTMHAAVGNVFGAGLDNFAPKLLRISSGIGLRTNGPPESQFEVLVGFGTETFEDGAKITSARLAFGGTYGF
jgi:hypothetical protein